MTRVNVEVLMDPETSAAIVQYGAEGADPQELVLEHDLLQFLAALPPDAIKRALYAGLAIHMEESMGFKPPAVLAAEAKRARRAQRNLAQAAGRA